MMAYLAFRLQPPAKKKKKKVRFSLHAKMLCWTFYLFDGSCSFIGQRKTRNKKTHGVVTDPL